MSDDGKHEHLGDGVYLSDDGFQLWVAVNDHRNPVVAFDPEVFERLVHQGLARMKKLYPSYTLKF